jgi:hypothetical protein
MYSAVEESETLFFTSIRFAFGCKTFQGQLCANQNQKGSFEDTKLNNSF